MSDQSENRILIKDVLLVESEFLRTEFGFTEDVKEEVSLSLKIENENEKEFFVYVFLNFDLKNKTNEELVKSKVIMKGIFELTNEKPTYFNDFICINAPAIIYPYLREHLSSLTNKSGLPPVNLPPFNFVHFGKEYMKEKLKESIEASKNPVKN